MSQRSQAIPEALGMLGYDYLTIGEIMDYIVLNQTAEGCSWFPENEEGEEHRAMVEGMIPDVPSEQWEEADLAWGRIKVPVGM